MKIKIIVSLILIAVIVGGAIFYFKKINPGVMDETSSVINNNLDATNKNAIPDESSTVNDSEAKSDFGDDGGVVVPDDSEEDVIEDNMDKIDTIPGAYKINRDDCDNDCENLADEELSYCQQVCGIKGIDENRGDCDGLSNLEKDYCLKDLAVIQKNYDICEEIADGKIKRTCIDRITEEILIQQE